MEHYNTHILFLALPHMLIIFISSSTRPPSGAGDEEELLQLSRGVVSATASGSLEEDADGGSAKTK